MSPEESDRVDFIAHLRLRSPEYGDVIDALLDDDVYTQAGRLNRSALCRKLNISGTTLNTILNELRVVSERLLN